MELAPNHTLSLRASFPYYISSLKSLKNFPPQPLLILILAYNVNWGNKVKRFLWHLKGMSEKYCSTLGKHVRKQLSKNPGT